MQQVKMSWDWLGGFFEGEGSIHWYQSKTKTKQGISGRIFIGQKIKDPLQQVYDFLEGEGFERARLYLRKQAKKSINALADPVEIWVIAIQQRDEVVRFLENIIPFLIQKEEKALFVLDSLKGYRDERDKVLQEASELKKSGLSWREVSRQLGIGRRSLINYATSKGIDIKKTNNREDGKSWKKDRIERGLCASCGKPRGEDGTLWLCRPCTDKHNKRTRERKAMILSEGLCVTCEKPKGDNGTKTLCRKCADSRKQPTARKEAP